ncbi:hypothetical protein [Mesorhizobium sp.]|nr:hypothetical protein [Mesorhizobium sp.]
MQRGIFTKIQPSNPAKASSDAVNPKPAAFIEGSFYRRQLFIEEGAF